MNKKKIALLFGGASSEHVISCKSVMTFINNISRDKYTVSLIGITEGGEWYLYEGDTALIPTDKWASAPEKKELFASFGAEKGLFYLEGGEKKRSIQAAEGIDSYRKLVRTFLCIPCREALSRRGTRQACKS